MEKERASIQTLELGLGPNDNDSRDGGDNHSSHRRGVSGAELRVPHEFSQVIVSGTLLT